LSGQLATKILSTGPPCMNRELWEKMSAVAGEWQINLTVEERPIGTWLFCVFLKIDVCRGLKLG